MSASLFEPQLFEDDEGKLLPLALDDELFVLERAKISFQVKDPAYVRSQAVVLAYAIYRIRG